MPSFLVSPQYNPYQNIAVEQYLLNRPSTGEVILYLWRNQRTVVIGQNQNPYTECDVDALEGDGGCLMRRRTGGGAVYHDLGNVNFSFVIPNECYDIVRQLGVIRKAVEDYGLSTEVSGRNDMLCQGKKFSGNAFSRGKQQRLHHGTILIHTDVGPLQRYLKVKTSKLQRHGVASVQSRVVNLSDLNPSITAQDIIPRLIWAFEQEYGSPVEELDFGTISHYAEVQRLRELFASREWNYGRWREFHSTRTAQFGWGEVEIAFTVDEEHSHIADVTIASDSLYPDIIGEACQLLQGASIHHAPAIPTDDTGDTYRKQILCDIVRMVYEP